MALNVKTAGINDVHAELLGQRMATPVLCLLNMLAFTESGLAPPPPGNDNVPSIQKTKILFVYRSLFHSVLEWYLWWP